MPGRPSRALPSFEHKHRLLTQRVTSRVHSIADALVVKDQNLYFLSDPSGRVPLEKGHGLGLYYHDCRYLDGYDLRLGDQSPLGLGAEAGRGYVVLVEATNEAPMPGKARWAGDPEDNEIEKQQLELSWHRVLDGGTGALHDELTVRNAGPGRARFPLRLAFSADFEDIFRIRGKLAERQGRHHQPVWRDGALRMAMTGADGLVRSTWIRFEPAPERTDGTRVEFDIDLAATERQQVLVTIAACESKHLPRVAPAQVRTKDRARADRERRHPREPWLEHQTRVRSGSLIFDDIMTRSLVDVRTLISTDAARHYLAAGVPWYVALFGRDSLIAALQMLAYDPRIAADTLRLLAQLQGRVEDAWRDEEPGKILHELRVGEYARMGVIPHTPYYGSVDATPLFLCVLGRHAIWTGDLGLFHELRPNVDAALEWLERYGDADGDGYVEYATRSEEGLVNQGWKDSGDGIINTDGSLVTPPVRLAEVQGYVYQAWRLMADLIEQDGDPDRAARLRKRAAVLRTRFEQDFWSEELGTYVLALQGPARTQAGVATSNAGQVLWSGIASAERARRTAERLMRDDLFSGWGVRTLSTRELRFNPIGYHLGTVWPHDNSLIAAGFRRYGLDDATMRLFDGLMEAAMFFPNHRLPETFAGFSRDDYGTPVHYPVACHPQAWAAGSIPYLLQVSLGLVPNGFTRSLRIVRPVLPEQVPWVELRGLRVAGGEVDLRFDRAPGGVDVEVIDVREGVQVTVEGARRVRRRRPLS